MKFQFHPDVLNFANENKYFIIMNSSAKLGRESYQKIMTLIAVLVSAETIQQIFCIQDCSR